MTKINPGVAQQPVKTLPLGFFLPQQSETLEFLYAADGILDFYAAIAFRDDFLPPRFGYDVYNDGNSLFLEVTNNVPISSAIWLLGFGLVGLVGLRRKLNQ